MSLRFQLFSGVHGWTEVRIRALTTMTDDYGLLGYHILCLSTHV